MKNPFIAAAVAMTVMASQTRQKIIDQYVADHGHDPFPRRRTRLRRAGRNNPAGSKILRRFYQNVNGTKTNYAEARRWYSNLRKS